MTKTGCYDDDYQLILSDDAVTTTPTTTTRTIDGNNITSTPQLRLIEVPEHSSETETSTSPGTPRQVGGAAAAGGLLGLIVAGPIGGVLVAGGAAMVAATTNGKAGNVARASGEVMATAGDRLKVWNEQHQVTEKTARAFSKTGKSLRNFDDKHKVTEKAATGVVQTCNWMTKKKLQSTTKQPTQNSDAHTTRLQSE